MKMRTSVRPILITSLIIGSSIAILALRQNPMFNFIGFSNPEVNRVLNHQLSMLLIAVFMLVFTFFLSGSVRLSLLNIQNKDGEITPEPFLGIKPSAEESWKHLGRNFAIIITLVTAIVIYFQNIRNAQPVWQVWPGILMALVFSVTNSFSEEVIYRLSISSVAENEKLSPVIPKAISAILFGVVHYFGNPGGIPGVLLAAFLGWFLTKSILETKGFFWAWLIHFLQDVIIFNALFAAA